MKKVNEALKANSFWASLLEARAEGLKEMHDKKCKKTRIGKVGTKIPSVIKQRRS